MQDRRKARARPWSSILLLIFAAGVAACAAHVNPRTPAPLVSGATTLPLRTTPPAESYPETWACPAALINPVRMLRDGETISFELLDGRGVSLVWPRGFSARLLDGRAEIVAPDGSVTARDGDEITGLVGDAREICEVDGVTYPPAS